MNRSPEPRSPAGQLAPASQLENVPRLTAEYFLIEPEPGADGQRVAFGTSGHRGSAANGSFNERHVLAISQAVCDYRRQADIDGPLFLGADTHALSEPALMTAVEVFSANGVELMIDADRGYTPTPAVSHAILTYNRDRSAHLADGVILTPSHNPPGDGGYKYNPPHGGPAGTEVTSWIERRANALLADSAGLRRWPWSRAIAAPTVHRHDYVSSYVGDLGSVIDMDVISNSGIRLGADPMGGSGIAYWPAIADRYDLDLDVVNETVDASFRFMPLDHDGRIRMDCSSSAAMANLIALKDRYDIAFGNDTDFDRHGIVVPDAGLMNPNHYLAVVVDYLATHRPQWRTSASIGKTLVTTSMIDRVAAAHGRGLAEVPVGFKWFVEGLAGGDLAFGGEESAGASFLRKDGRAWTTDKDGIILALAGAEITARTGSSPGLHYRRLAEQHGDPAYARIDAPATPAQKDCLKGLSAEAVTAEELAGERIVQRLTRAPANDAPIGGLKVVTANAWFAARPSGTEDIYKIYAESFRGEAHLAEVQAAARAVVAAALGQ